MQGFDTRFKDLRDYILKITYEIWEEKGIDKIRDYYNKYCPVYTPLSFSNDVEEIIKGTLQTLYMFPDRELLAEDVIGKDCGNGIFYSSHRIYSQMTHLGDGFFGAPSNNTVKVKTIADCVCQENKIIKEWLVRDQSAITNYIGLDSQKFGSSLAAIFDIKSADEYEKSWSSGQVTMDTESQILSDFMQDLLENANINSILDVHHRFCNVHCPNDTTLMRSIDVAEYFNSLLASFPKAKFKVHHSITMKEENTPIRVALRWTLKAIHSGHGRYGAPSKASICIMGISHFELLYGKIRFATHLFDELSIWAQIAAHISKCNKNKFSSRSNND